MVQDPGSKPVSSFSSYMQAKAGKPTEPGAPAPSAPGRHSKTTSHTYAHTAGPQPQPSSKQPPTNAQ